MLRRSKTEGKDVGVPTHILVVDDDRDSCELIARILEGAGWTADRAYSHEEAIGAIYSAKPPFTAIVVDFSGGGISSSLKLLDAIRQEKEFHETPVLLLTRVDTNRNFAWQSGADAFLVRPFHADDLINEVFACLTRTPEEREAHRQTAIGANAG